ncbi:TcpE family conjugal transfer membrane protein [Enterococcus sp. HY326]|uniref:TcpE family conjugal transfer membrane protein n=1 Tax=Enterococcus sp. HY326 TaxID=2971265 RepID=UPI00223EF2A4|nr:TcpE family conjugal transfer membrane protein [Enterococcus sp. HY326]
MKQCYNYKYIFDEPAKIRKLWKITLPVALPLARFMIMVVVIAILYIFFRGVIEFLNSLLGGLQYLIYLGVPWIISGVILKLNPDGQKLHWYLFDLGKFMFLIFLPKKKFCQDEVVHLPKKVVFQKYEE